MLIGTTTQERAMGAAPSIDAQVQEFTRLYEAHAYLIYNLALRTTCEAKGAFGPVERAFVGVAAAPEADLPWLVANVTGAAIGEAKRRPRASGVGEAELPLLSAAATLPAPERAALALNVLADADTPLIGEALGVGEAAAGELLERAVAGFAAALGVDGDAGSAAYRDWGWAEPPVELWQRIYPAFRKALERRGTAEAATAGGAVAAGSLAQPAAAQASKPSRTRNWRRRLTGLGTAVAAGLLAAGVLAYVHRNDGKRPATPPVASLYGNSATPAPAAPLPQPDTSATASGPSDPVAAVQAKPHKPLTPKQLDALRLDELAALRNYQKRETDKRLTQAQRDYAAGKVAKLQGLARERAALRLQQRALDKQQRELAKQRAADARRRQREQQRQEQQAASQQPYQQQPAQQQPSNQQQGGQSGGSGSSSGSTTPQQTQQTCVQDQDSGQWICPN
jgi:hypothetical protein